MSEGTQLLLLKNYILTKGVKKFGKQGKDAALKELKQLNKRVVFETISRNYLTEQ